MTSTVPMQPTIQAPSGVASQNSSVSTALSTLSDSSVADTLKAAVLQYRISQVIKQNESMGIQTGVDITDLQTGQNLLSHEVNLAQYAASINKLPIAMLLEQGLRAGQVRLSDHLSWSASDVRGGYGVYDQPGAPTNATVQQLIFDMLNHSGNTAVRVLVNKTSLGGAMAVNNRLAMYPQLVQTQLQIVSSDGFYLGNTTPGESLWTMQQVQKTKDSYEQFMQNAMATNIFTDYGVRSQLAGNNYIVLANKVGILDDPTGTGTNRHDVGIIYNTETHRSFAYSLMTTNFSNGNDLTAQAESSLQQMGLDILRFAGDKPATAAPKAQTMAPVQHQEYREGKVLY